MIYFGLLVALASVAYADYVPTYGTPIAGIPYAHHATIGAAPYVVPHTVAKVSTYTPTAAALPTVHASVPTTVAGAPVHHIPGYTYLPRYSHRVDAQPLRYRYAYGLAPYGLNYGYGAYGYTPIGH